MGHRVLGHEGKCSNLHGHNYVAMVTAATGRLDDVGRVIDFSVLKSVVGSWIEENWDHGTILFMDDPAAQLWGPGAPLEGHKVYVSEFNPTAENIAAYLLSVGNVLLNDLPVKVTEVVVWETENCYATARLSPYARKEKVGDGYRLVVPK